MFRRLLILTLLSLGLVGGVANRCDASAAGMTSMPKPFFFTENKGQWDSRVLYKCSAKNGMTWFLERDGITLLVSKEDHTKAALVDPFERDLPEMLRRHPARYPMKAHALKFHFVKGEGSKVNGERVTNNADSFDRSFSTQHPTPSTLHRVEAQSVEANGELPWHNNYFLGNDSSKWAPNCRNYSSVVYREVWDGIDIEWYENEGKLEFDFVVHPGFDPNQIRMSCEGLEDDLSLRGSEATKQSQMESDRHVTTDAQGRIVRSSRRQEATDKSVCHTGTELRLQTSLGELRTALPSVYQISANGTRTEIDAAFELTDKNTFGIILPNGHDRENTLRIDPLIYSTFLGGSNNDGGYGVVSDGNGGVIVTGNTLSSNFPTIAGAIDPTYNGGTYNGDCFVTHLNADGSQLLYSTYLGGTGDDFSAGIVDDDSGGVIIAGGTTSFNYPVTAAAFDRIYNGGQTGDCFVTRLNSQGSRLLYSTFLGGSDSEGAYAIIGDGSGGVFLTGGTRSTNFPTTLGAYDTSYNGVGAGSQNCFVTHLNSAGSQLIYSTYLGGSIGEDGRAIAVDRSGSVVVTGMTASQNFPITNDAFSTSINGSNDCYVTRFNSAGSELVFSTYLGGVGDDLGITILVEEDGSCVISGITTSNNFPTTPNAYDTSYNGSNVQFGGDCFITRLNSSGSQLIYSTFLGGIGHDAGNSITRDSRGYICIFGITSSTDFPTTPTAFQSFNAGDYDCFLSILDSSGSRLHYSTYLGGNSAEGASSILLFTDNEFVVIGGTSSSNFPVTTNSFDPTWNGGSDCFVTRIHIDTVDVAQERVQLPLDFSMQQNYPNPFNSSTAIGYSIPKTSVVKLELFDLLGRTVAVLVNARQTAGKYEVRFSNTAFASGEYFYRLSTKDQAITRKMVIVR